MTKKKLNLKLKNGDNINYLCQNYVANENIYTEK